MKPHLFLIALVLIIISSCNKENPNEFNECDEYFYYSSGRKIYVGDVANRIWIEYVNDSINAIDANNVLSKYDFLNLEHILEDHRSINSISIKTQSNCEEYKEILKTINKDPEIEAATPAFLNGFVLLNDILLEPNDNISEASIVSYCYKLGLVLREKSKYNTYVFEVSKSNSITGFEGFEISNTIYESGKVKYSHPNFIAPAGLDDL